MREEKWVHGQLHGECRSFYPSGPLQMREQWQQGLRHSLSAGRLASSAAIL